MNEYLMHDLLLQWAKNEVDPLNEDELQDYVYNMFKTIPSDLWTEEWNVKTQDNSNVRTLIKNDIETVLINTRLGRNWRKKLRLIDPES